MLVFHNQSTSLVSTEVSEQVWSVNKILFHVSTFTASNNVLCKKVGWLCVTIAWFAFWGTKGDSSSTPWKQVAPRAMIYLYSRLGRTTLMQPSIKCTIVLCLDAQLIAITILLAKAIKLIWHYRLKHGLIMYATIWYNCYFCYSVFHCLAIVTLCHCLTIVTLQIVHD